MLTGVRKASWARTQGEAHAGCMGEPEDDDPAKIRSVIQGCGEFGISHLKVGYQDRLARRLSAATIGFFADHHRVGSVEVFDNSRA